MGACLEVWGLAWRFGGLLGGLGAESPPIHQFSSSKLTLGLSIPLNNVYYARVVVMWCFWVGWHILCFVFF